MQEDLVPPGRRCQGGWIEDEICENCRWWSVQYKECYADDPENGHCFESKYADAYEVNDDVDD